MPVLQPAELWRRTGRYEIEELFKLKDRRGADLVLAMTHEEVVTSHVAAARALLPRPAADPLPLPGQGARRAAPARRRAAHARVRDEGLLQLRPRPRRGWSAPTSCHVDAYDRIFERTGLRWYRVEGDVGHDGRRRRRTSTWRRAPAGENEVALAPGYAANVEVASARRAAGRAAGAAAARRRTWTTPGATTIADVARAARAAGRRAAEGVPGRPSRIVRDRAGDACAATTASTRSSSRARSARPGARRRAEEIAAAIGPPGFIGPVGARLPVLLDDGVAPGPYVVGANRADTHLRGVEPGRDFAFERADVRIVEARRHWSAERAITDRAGDRGRRTSSSSAPATRSALGASYLDEQGSEQPIWMGSYGIGLARIAAAAVEQFADEHGISWPRAIAPFDVHLVALGKPGSAERDAGRRLYDDAARGRASTCSTTTARRAPGEKFADAELLGCPAAV